MNWLDDLLTDSLEDFRLLDDYEVICFLINVYGRNQADMNLLLTNPGLPCLVEWVKSGFDDHYLIQAGINRDMRSVIKSALKDNQLFEAYLLNF